PRLRHAPHHGHGRDRRGLSTGGAARCPARRRHGAGGRLPRGARAVGTVAGVARAGMGSSRRASTSSTTHITSGGTSAPARKPVATGSCQERGQKSRRQLPSAKAKSEDRPRQRKGASRALYGRRGGSRSESPMRSVVASRSPKA